MLPHMGHVQSPPDQIESASSLKAFALAAATRHHDSFVAALAERRFHFSVKGRGSRPMEALLIASVVAELNADAFIESGRARGDGAIQVAAALHRIRSGLGLPPIEFHSLEWTKSRTHSPADDKFARARLSKIPNVTFHDDNSLKLVPQLLRQLGAAGKRTVVFVDGPKGYASLILLREAVRHRHVIALFEADAQQGWDARGGIDNLIQGRARDLNRAQWPCKTEAFATDDPDYVARFRDVDERFFPKATWTMPKGQRPPCCKYAAPAPCFGNVTLPDAVILMMRARPAGPCLNEFPPNRTLPSPKCQTSSGKTPTWRPALVQDCRKIDCRIAH